MEKELLIKEADQGYTTSATSTLNSSSDRILSKHQVDELSDLVRTKEEEIQILWNVIKEINKLKSGAINNIS